MSFGVVYQVKKSYKRLEYRLFIFLKISKTDIFAQIWARSLFPNITYPVEKEVGVVLYYTMNKSYVSIPN